MIYSRQIMHTTDGKEEYILGRGGGHSKGKVVFLGAMSNLVSKKNGDHSKKKKWRPPVCACLVYGSWLCTAGQWGEGLSKVC